MIIRLVWTTWTPMSAVPKRPLNLTTHTLTPHYRSFTKRQLVPPGFPPQRSHYGDVTMGAIVSQITSLTIVYSTVYSDAYQRKHQSSASPAFVRGIHRGPVNSPHKWPVTRKMFPLDDVIMSNEWDRLSMLWNDRGIEILYVYLRWVMIRCER